MSNVSNLIPTATVVEVTLARITPPEDVRPGQKLADSGGRTWNAISYSAVVEYYGVSPVEARVQLVPDECYGYPLHCPHAVDSDSGPLYVIAEVQP